eukprot:scaffold6670_cov330-Prasinococcus_capsulatus_cf.AAC.3
MCRLGERELLTPKPALESRTAAAAGPTSPCLGPLSARGIDCRDRVDGTLGALVSWVGDWAVRVGAWRGAVTPAYSSLPACRTKQSPRQPPHRADGVGC